MPAFAGCLAFVILSAVPSSYQINLKGGGTYLSRERPAEQSGRYVFRTPEGTLMSIRKTDVAQIRRSVAVAPAAETNRLGPTSPAAAAKYQKLYAGQLRGVRSAAPVPLSRQDPYFKQSPYRPGVGEAYPGSPNDYAVGKTFAYPPSGTVYEGLPPNKAPEGGAPNKTPEGPAPHLQTPPPPPPPNR